MHEEPAQHAPRGWAQTTAAQVALAAANDPPPEAHWALVASVHTPLVLQQAPVWAKPGAQSVSAAAAGTTQA